MNEAPGTTAARARTVNDGVGHSHTISVNGGEMILSDTLDPAVQVRMKKDEAEILHAFLSVSLKMPHRSDFSEDLREGRRLTLMDHGSPHVRLTGDSWFMDIYSPSWEPLLCEISLVLPRIRD